jgi:hypothetical protein
MGAVSAGASITAQIHTLPRSRAAPQEYSAVVRYADSAIPFFRLRSEEVANIRKQRGQDVVVECKTLDGTSWYAGHGIPRR